MVRYLQLFYILSFFLIILLAVVVGVYFRASSANHIIRGSIENYAEVVSQSFVNHVWKEHRKIFLLLHEKQPQQLKNFPEYQAFEEEGKRFFSNVPLVRFSLFTPDMKRYFVSQDIEIIPEKPGFISSLPFMGQYGVMGIDLIRSGEPMDSAIIERATVHHFNANVFDVGDEIQGSYVQVLIPIRDESGHIEAIVEMYYDVTKAWGYLVKFQIVGTVGIIFFFSVLYIALFLVSWRAGRVIERQHEANSALKEAKIRAEAESEEKSKFLANVSHELRTPLNAIIGFSQIMKDETNGPIGNAQYKEYITDINQSGSHLLSLINDILDYSKAEANKLEVEQVEFDLNKILKTTLRLVLPRAEDAKVNLVDNVPKDHIVMKADSKRMKQIILNLLSNAVKFTPEGGNVTLSLKTVANGVVIEVNDTGIGIGSKDIAKAMATFGQVDSKLSRRYEGTGLGLPLTKKLVELMGGVFEIQSELGLGTTVTIHFPSTLITSQG